MARTTRKSEKVNSRLVLFEPRSGEQTYNFVIGLTEETIEAIIELYDSGAEADKYGAVVKLGGCLYENDNNIAGTVFVREEEEEEAPKRRKTSKARKRVEEDDEDEDEPPVRQRAKRKRTLR